jgi:polyhydroxyalkanoate synthase
MSERARSGEMAPRRAALEERLGPRPLALHLAFTGLTWMLSRAALPSWKSVSADWNWKTAAERAQLLQAAESLDLESLAAALDREIADRAARFAVALDSYRHHPYRRQEGPQETIWREGATHLIDFGRPDGEVIGPPLFFVPSLVNRSYILDLRPDCSLVRWLKSQGFRVFLADWGAPGDEERDFGLDDYISRRLSAMLDQVLAEAGARPVLVGYCMGGLLALALSQQRRADLRGLALLATPWDFHVPSRERARLVASAFLGFAPLMAASGQLPVDAIQALFASLDPLLVVRKFLAFNELDPQSAGAKTFVALEDWLNDGVALTIPVAGECLLGWYGRNAPALGDWRIGGHVVAPEQVDLPTLCMVPDGDRIVPPEAAVALAKRLPDCHTLRPKAGHIGMIVSARARARVWQPLVDWIGSLPAD